MNKFWVTQAKPVIIIHYPGGIRMFHLNISNAPNAQCGITNNAVTYLYLGWNFSQESCSVKFRSSVSLNFIVSVKNCN